MKSWAEDWMTDRADEMPTARQLAAGALLVLMGAVANIILALVLR